MTDDEPDHEETDLASRQADTGRDACGRWKKGYCPNPRGRPKKVRRADYNPSDIRDFMRTQIEVATADGPQMMDRRTALLHKAFEGAMKGKVTPMRKLMEEIQRSDQQLAELRYHFDGLMTRLILDNPRFKNLDVSLSHVQRNELIGIAAVLNHYHPGQYGAILGLSEDATETAPADGFAARLALQRARTESSS